MRREALDELYRGHVATLRGRVEYWREATQRAETRLAAANALLARARKLVHGQVGEAIDSHLAVQPATAPTTTYGNPPRCIVCDVDEGEHRPGCPHGPAKPAVAHDPRPPCPCGDQTHPGHPLGWCRPL